MVRDIRKVGIVGAGIAGLACARRLRDAGLAVRLFDKGRSPGGRIATRRLETAAGPVQFDHGAQFFTARHPDLRTALKSFPIAASKLWRGQGVGDDWLVAAPGMSALPRALADGLEISMSTRVASIAREGERWTLSDDVGQTFGNLDVVMFAVPAEQAAPLLAPIAPRFADEAARAVTAPCWAGLFAFTEPLMMEKVAFELEGHPVLSWIACDSAKPGRKVEPQCWVAHARADWTRVQLEAAPEDIAPKLLDALVSVLGPVSKPLLMQAHRWRYAKVEHATGSPFAWDPHLGLGVCGDWRLGPSIELAWRSGHELAGAVLA